MGNKYAFKEIAALGKLPYIEKANLIGRNAAISNSAETLWLPGATYAQLLAGVAMEAVSSSANDAAAGTGARTIQVDYIDGNYDAGSEVITLNGTTPVPLVATSVLAINKITVLTAGSGLTNAGSVDVRTVSGSTVNARIGGAETGGVSSGFSYTVPRGFIGLLGNVNYGGTGVTGDLTVYVLKHDSAGAVNTLGIHKSSLYVTAFNGAQGVIDLGSGVLIPEKTHIEGRAIVSAGAGDLIAQAELLLFDVKQNGMF